MICAQDTGVSLIERKFSQKKTERRFHSAHRGKGLVARRIQFLIPSRVLAVCSIQDVFGLDKLYDGLIDPVFFPQLQFGPSPGKSSSRNVGLDVERVFVTASPASSGRTSFPTLSTSRKETRIKSHLKVCQLI